MPYFGVAFPEHCQSLCWTKKKKSEVVPANKKVGTRSAPETEGRGNRRWAIEKKIRIVIGDDVTDTELHLIVSFHPQS